MEASAKGAFEAGGHTIGITADELGGKANPWIREERRMKTWRERLFALIDTGDAYVVFDGATGTLVELFVTWEMANKKIHQKPIFLMGNEIQKFVRDIEKNSFRTLSPCLHPASSPEEVLGILKSRP